MARQRPNLAPRGKRRREQARMDAEALKLTRAVQPFANAMFQHFERQADVARKITDNILRGK